MKKRSNIVLKTFTAFLIIGGLFFLGFLIGKTNLNENIESTIKSMDKEVKINISSTLKEYFKKELVLKNYDIKFTNSKTPDLALVAKLQTSEPKSGSKIGYLALGNKFETEKINSVNLILFLEGKEDFEIVATGKTLVAEKSLELLLKEILPEYTFLQIVFIDSTESLTKDQILLFPAKNETVKFAEIDGENIFVKDQNESVIDFIKIMEYPIKIELLYERNLENTGAERIEEKVLNKFDQTFSFEFTKPKQ